jgi:hypothetical protein
MQLDDECLDLTGLPAQRVWHGEVVTTECAGDRLVIVLDEPVPEHLVGRVQVSVE